MDDNTMSLNLWQINDKVIGWMSYQQMDAKSIRWMIIMYRWDWEGWMTHVWMDDNLFGCISDRLMIEIQMDG